MFYLRLEILRKPAYQLRRAQLYHELDKNKSKAKQFKNICCSTSSSHVIAIGMLHV